MKKIIRIKETNINEGIPVICVPIVAGRKQDIIDQAWNFVSRGAEMIEWRLDFFEGIHDDAQILEVLEALDEICTNTVLLATIRSRRQGGNVQLSEEELISRLELMAGSHKADMLDVEFFELEKPGKVIERLQKQGVCVLTSHHDFHLTPDREVMMTLLEQMENGGADIVKIAVMPQKPQDVLDLLGVTAEFYEKYPETPVVSMSMGHMGLISRLSGETFGSCITFATMEHSSAPGQPKAEDLLGVLRFLDAEGV